jgi:hypothetical protein
MTQIIDEELDLDKVQPELREQIIEVLNDPQCWTECTVEELFEMIDNVSVEPK